MGHKKNNADGRLPYGTYSAVARIIKEEGGSPTTASGVWRAIHESEDTYVIQTAADYIREQESKRRRTIKRLGNALATS